MKKTSQEYHYRCPLMPQQEMKLSQMDTSVVSRLNKVNRTKKKKEDKKS